MTQQALVPALAALLLPVTFGCITADRPAVVPPSAEAAVPAEPPEPLPDFLAANECPVDAGDAAAACLEDDLASCCSLASIPHEYEWLEARHNNDADAAARHRAAMLELLSHGCDLESDACCDILEGTVEHDQDRS